MLQPIQPPVHRQKRFLHHVLGQAPVPGEKLSKHQRLGLVTLHQQAKRLQVAPATISEYVLQFWNL